MKPPIAWLVRFGLAGSCLILAGCGGGGDVPDPDSDSKAAAAPAPGAPPPVAVAANTEQAPAPVAEAPASEEAAKDAPASAADGSAVALAPATAAEATPPGDAETKPEAGSATNEMLALAGAPAAPAVDAPAEGADAPAAPSGPGAPAVSGPQGPGATKGMMQGYPGMAGGPTSGPPPGGPAGTAAMMNNMGRGGPGVAGGPGAMMGGMNGANNQPPDYRTPLAGAQSFLNALKNRDAAALAEATALRAPTEASVKNRKLFEAIVIQELTPEDLAELAQKLDGFTISGNNHPKSQSKLGINLSKSEGGSLLMRTIEVRKEKAGWKVCDISGQGEIAPIMGLRGRSSKKAKP